MWRKSAIERVGGRIPNIPNIAAGCIIRSSRFRWHRNVSETHFLAGEADSLSDGNGIFPGTIYYFCFDFLVFLGAIVWSYFKNKNVFFWLVFFVITLLPTLTPFKISWIVAERYVYLGTLGIIVCVAMLFDNFLKMNENAKMVGYFALVLIVASLSVRTIIRNQDWKSEDTFGLQQPKSRLPASKSTTIWETFMPGREIWKKRSKNSKKRSKSIRITPTPITIWPIPISKWDRSTWRCKIIKKLLRSIPKLWQSYQNLAAIYFNQGRYFLQKPREHAKSS